MPAPAGVTTCVPPFASVVTVTPANGAPVLRSDTPPCRAGGFSVPVAGESSSIVTNTASAHFGPKSRRTDGPIRVRPCASRALPVCLNEIHFMGCHFFVTRPAHLTIIDNGRDCNRMASGYYGFITALEITVLDTKPIAISMALAH
jgi:hypothetical protein